MLLRSSFEIAELIDDGRDLNDTRAGDLGPVEKLDGSFEVRIDGGGAARLSSDSSSCSSCEERANAP